MLGRRTTKPDNIMPFTRATHLNTGLGICDCPIQKSRLHTQYRWASATFFTQTESVMHHLPGCKFTLHPSHDSSRAYGIAFNTGVHRIINKAVKISISLNCRSGTTSIAPIIQYRTVVDRTRAPAFRLVRLLYKWLNLIEQVHIEERAFVAPKQMKHDMDRFIHHCFSGILMSFHQKKGSPVDVDHLHQSLAHHLLAVVSDLLTIFIPTNSYSLKKYISR